MNKSVKKVAIVAAIMVGAGVILAGIGFLAGGGQSIGFGSDGINLGGNNENNNGKINEKTKAFSNIKVDMGQYNVKLVADDSYSVEGSYDEEEGKPIIKVENGTLIIKDKNKGHFKINIDIFGLNLDGERSGKNIEIHYPADLKLNDVEIACDASDFSAESLKAKNLQITNDLGTVEIKKISVESLKVDANAGDLIIEDTDAEKSDISLDLGSFTSKDFNTNGLSVNANSGDVELSGKFLGETNIECDLGNVELYTDVKKESYNYELDVDLGTVSVENEENESSMSLNQDGAENQIVIKANLGDIKVDFK